MYVFEHNQGDECIVDFCFVLYLNESHTSFHVEMSENSKSIFTPAMQATD